jgi:hypothetical protein
VSPDLGEPIVITTTATNKKVRELLKSVREGSLIPRPEFQRRLVWTAKDKDKFIESVVKGYPFPEIYMCNGEVDTETGEGTQLLVDGLQRVSTLNEYFTADNNFSHVLTVPYRELHKDEQQKFLEYNVVVRDLGSLTKDQIIEVFRRLNSTQYTLRDMEVNNAIYDGALKTFCEKMSVAPFFDSHRVFSASDRKRMGDVAFCLSLVGTMMVGYFNRDVEHEPLLSRFNEAFPDQVDYERRIDKTLDFIDECGFDDKSRIWKKADFFSAFVEIDNALHIDRIGLDPSNVLDSLNEFYSVVDSGTEDKPEIGNVYYKSALQASNDRNNRLRRGRIVSGLLRQEASEAIVEDLRKTSLI